VFSPGARAGRGQASLEVALFNPQSSRALHLLSFQLEVTSQYPSGVLEARGTTIVAPLPWLKLERRPPLGIRLNFDTLFHSAANDLPISRPYRCRFHIEDERCQSCQLLLSLRCPSRHVATTVRAATAAPWHRYVANQVPSTLGHGSGRKEQRSPPVTQESPYALRALTRARRVC